MRDLEIRGAGNLLGDEQSGHVAALGLRALHADARRGGRRRSRPRAADEDWEPVRLDVNVDAYVPADYIPYEQAKVDVHRRIAASREVADLVVLREELEDRFGELPEPLQQPDRAPAGAHQARPGRRPGRHVPRRPAGGDPVELDSVRAKRIRAGDPRGAVRVGQVPALDARSRRSGQALPGRGPGGRRAAGGHAGGGVGRERGRCRRRSAALGEYRRPLFERSSAAFHRS